MVVLTMASVTVAVTGKDHKGRAVSSGELGVALAFGGFPAPPSSATTGLARTISAA